MNSYDFDQIEDLKALLRETNKHLGRIADALNGIGGELNLARLNMPEPQVIEINK